MDVARSTATGTDPRQRWNGRPQATLSDRESAAFDHWLDALGRYRAVAPEAAEAASLKGDVDRLWLAYELAVDQAQEPT
ncbi:MAG TPA: hypothetical protein VKR24_05740 [Candidatus Limnocylindrales bacterium]|nr:hypothetical protein [Candidatus Limnocylindrales bacterium]